MSNEIREKDHEWVKTFHSNFDRLLALLEKLLEKRQPSAYSDELLTDKEVAYLLKVSRRTGLSQQRNSALHTGRRQDSLSGFRHRKDTDERVQGSVQIQKELITQASPKRTRKDFDFSGGSAVDRLPILFVFLKNSLSK